MYVVSACAALPTPRCRCRGFRQCTWLDRAAPRFRDSDAEFYPSRHTIEWHLRKAFYKLGIVFRRERHNALAHDEHDNPGVPAFPDGDCSQQVRAVWPVSESSNDVGSFMDTRSTS